MTDQVVTIGGAFAGDTFLNVDCGHRLLRVEKAGFQLVQDCILGAIDVRNAGTLEELSWCTFDPDGPYMRVHQGDFRNTIPTDGIRQVLHNRLLNIPSDGIVTNGTTQAGGIVIHGNYIGRPWNLVEESQPWDAGRTYSQIDTCLNAAGIRFRSRADGNIGNPPPAGATNIETEFGDAYWENYNGGQRGGAPHTDAIVVKGAPGDGVLVERNLIEWGVDEVASPGPVTGQNNWFRLDRGNSGFDEKVTNAVTVRENMAWHDVNTGSFPIDIAPRSQVNFNGPIAFTDNFLRPRTNGLYRTGGEHIDIWTGNVDALTGDPVP